MDKQKVSSVVREEKDNSADDGNVKRERAIEKRSRAEVMLVKVTQNAVEELCAICNLIWVKPSTAVRVHGH